MVTAWPAGMIGTSPLTSQSSSLTTSPLRPSPVHTAAVSSSESCVASPVLSQQIALPPGVGVGAACAASTAGAAASGGAGGGGGAAAAAPPGGGGAGGGFGGLF